MIYTIVNIVATIIVVPLLYLVYKSMTRPKNFPPGPVGLPILGSFYKIVPELNEKIPKLAETYGNIFGLKLCMRNVICLVGYDLIKEVIYDRVKDFSDRNNNGMSRAARGANREGIALADYGPKWAANRKFLHTVFRNMGLNKSGIEKCVTNELPAIIQELEKLCKFEESVDPSSIFEGASLNVLASFVFGNRYEYDDAKFERLLSLNNEYFKQGMFTGTLSGFAYSEMPYLSLIWKPPAIKKFMEIIDEIRNFAKTEIEHHKKTIDSQNPRDFIDYYLMELNKSSNEWLSEAGLEASIMDLFQAGIETTTATLRWAFLYMANNPDVQEKVHGEIDRVIGLDREPTYEDRLSMPYCEATRLEIQRKANIVPIGVTHVSTQDTTLRGFNIPKGTVAVPWMKSVHYSPDHWKNPENFDPENFLDSDGNVGTRDAFMPFGGGARICVGMAVAKQELFLFFIGILQKFKVLLPNGIKSLPEDSPGGPTVPPKPYKIKLQRRF